MRNTTSPERDEVSKVEASTLHGPLSAASAPATCISTRTAPWGLRSWDLVLCTLVLSCGALCMRQKGRL